MEERAKQLVFSFLTSTGGFIHPRDVHERVVAFVRAEVAAERERCARAAEAQPLYPDTHTGVRQEWVKRRIAAAVREGRGP